MNKFNIFSGAFTDEVGQRFLKSISDVCVSSFGELYDATMPKNKKLYQESLDRVATWNTRLVGDELSKVKLKYPDFEDCFAQVFSEYVKSMKGTPKVKLMIQVPRVDDFLLKFLVCFSSSACVQTTSYFSTYSVLDKRVCCLDCIRDALFSYLNDDFVQVIQKLEHKSVVSDSRHSRAYRGEGSEDSKMYSSRSSTDDGTKVISNIGSIQEDNDSEIYSQANRCHDDVRAIFDSVRPEDSVSNVNFATNQHIELRKLAESQEVNNLEPVREDAGSEHTVTSLSLSSVSLSQNGFVQKQKSCLKEHDSKSSDVSINSSSSISQQRKSQQGRRHREDGGEERRRKEDVMSQSTAMSVLKKYDSSSFPVKSYITSLTEEDEDD